MLLLWLYGNNNNVQIFANFRKEKVLKRYRVGLRCLRSWEIKMFRDSLKFAINNNINVDSALFDLTKTLKILWFIWKNI